MGVYPILSRHFKNWSPASADDGADRTRRARRCSTSSTTSSPSPFFRPPLLAKMSDAIPPSLEKPKTSWLPAKSWHHFVAGGLGGMCGAIVTSPFDVVKTRLQSDLFRAKHASVAFDGSGAATVVVRRNLLWNFVETAHIIRYALSAFRCWKRC